MMELADREIDKLINAYLHLIEKVQKLENEIRSFDLPDEVNQYILKGLNEYVIKVNKRIGQLKNSKKDKPKNEN